ncbi:hypothetical protein M0802_010175 [Mischocyttarus mexicanus]|nr:hypothetical protein M0802_010175 [Mischocyttarus mexicanus]
MEDVSVEAVKTASGFVPVRGAALSCIQQASKTHRVLLDHAFLMLLPAPKALQPHLQQGHRFNILVPHL